MKLIVNGEEKTVESNPSSPLLWVLRDELELTGTKFGCGVGICRACTVHVDGQAVRSCNIPLSAVEGKEIRTIEGLAPVDVREDGTRIWTSTQTQSRVQEFVSETTGLDQETIEVIPTMKEIPAVEAILVDTGGQEPTGVGETPIGPIGAAIANAVFSLTGERLRNKPFKMA